MTHDATGGRRSTMEIHRENLGSPVGPLTDPQTEDLRAHIRETWEHACYFRERIRRRDEEAQRCYALACWQRDLTRRLCDWQPLAGSDACQIRTASVALAEFPGEHNPGH